MLRGSSHQHQLLRGSRAALGEALILLLPRPLRHLVVRLDTEATAQHLYRLPLPHNNQTDVWPAVHIITRKISPSYNAAVISIMSYIFG